MKTLFLHIGLHKTGTTAIQVALNAAKATLADAGILYPESARPETSRFGQHEAAWAVMERENYVPAGWAQKGGYKTTQKEAIFSELLREIDNSSAQKVVLSSEEFDCLSSTEIKNLAQQFQNFRICPIIFLRHTSDFVESAYKTYMMHSNSVQDIVKFSSSQRSRTDFYQLVNDWLSVTNTDTLQIIDYDDPEVRADSFSMFCQCIGLDVPSLSKSRMRQNESSNAVMIEIIKYLRNNNVSAERIKEWLSKDPAVFQSGRGTTLMPPYLDSELDKQYRQEIKKIEKIESPRLKRIGEFKIRERTTRKWVSSPADAIMHLPENR